MCARFVLHGLCIPHPIVSVTSFGSMECMYVRVCVCTYMYRHVLLCKISDTCTSYNMYYKLMNILKKHSSCFSCKMYVEVN